MKMKRMRRTSRALIEAMEFTRDFTRFPIDDQYLKILNIISSEKSPEQNNVQEIPGYVVNALIISLDSSVLSLLNHSSYSTLVTLITLLVTMAGIYLFKDKTNG